MFNELVFVDCPRLLSWYFRSESIDLPSCRLGGRDSIPSTVVESDGTATRGNPRRVTPGWLMVSRWDGGRDPAGNPRLDLLIPEEIRRPASEFGQLIDPTGVRLYRQLAGRLTFAHHDVRRPKRLCD